MASKLDVKRKFLSRSARVKALDLHPSEPLLLVALYTGHVHIWNHKTGQLYKSLEVCDIPIRTAKFIARKQWIIVGSDDLMVRVFNYNTLEKVTEFSAHQDYLRSMAVHPTLPIVLTASDDGTICQWNWDQNWKSQVVYEGHSHFVMQVVFNPKDLSTFATASLDRTIKIWGLNTPRAYQTIEAHEKGVNCVEYYPGADKPYLVSGGDDQLVKVWDYQTKACVHTLSGHTSNISFVGFHPDVPIIISGSEDSSVRLWNAATYRLEKTLDYGLERAWCMCTLKGSRKVAFGFDDGSVIVRLGKDVPVASLDAASGKMILVQGVSQNEVVQLNLRGAASAGSADGERLSAQPKEMGTSESPIRMVRHDPAGRFVAALLSSDEWVVYTAIAWRSKAFGQGSYFAWGPESGTFAAAKSVGSAQISVYRNFEDDAASAFRSPVGIEQLFSGPLLGVRSTDAICFFDWKRPVTNAVVRRIDVVPRRVIWNDAATRVALVCDASFFVLKFNASVVASAFADTNPQIPDAGIEESFDLEDDVSEQVRDGQWVGQDLFVFLTRTGRLCCYAVGSQELIQLSACDRAATCWLGYMPREDRLFLLDKDRNVVSYRLPNVLLECFRLILALPPDAGEAESGEKLQPLRARIAEVPQESLSIVAKFLQMRGLKHLALETATDEEHRFDLAIELRKLDVAVSLAGKSESTLSQFRWRSIADIAVQENNIPLAERCFLASDDLPSLLMLYAITGNAAGMAQLAEKARKSGQDNIAYQAFLLLQRTDDCLSVLTSAGRHAEACLFARTYCPSRVPGLLAGWKNSMPGGETSRLGQALADPAEFPNLFDRWTTALQIDEALSSARTEGRFPPASAYPEMADALDWNLFEKFEETGGFKWSSQLGVPQSASLSVNGSAAGSSAAIDGQDDSQSMLWSTQTQSDSEMDRQSLVDDGMSVVSSTEPQADLADAETGDVSLDAAQQRQQQQQQQQGLSASGASGLSGAPAAARSPPSGATGNGGARGSPAPAPVSLLPPAASSTTNSRSRSPVSPADSTSSAGSAKSSAGAASTTTTATVVAGRATSGHRAAGEAAEADEQEYEDAEDDEGWGME